MKVSLNRLPAPAEAGVHGTVGLITTQAGSWNTTIWRSIMPPSERICNFGETNG